MGTIGTCCYTLPRSEQDWQSSSCCFVHSVRAWFLFGLGLLTTCTRTYGLLSSCISLVCFGAMSDLGYTLKIEVEHSWFAVFNPVVLLGTTCEASPRLPARIKLLIAR